MIRKHKNQELLCKILWIYNPIMIPLTTNKGTLGKLSIAAVVKTGVKAGEIKLSTINNKDIKIAQYEVLALK